MFFICVFIIKIYIERKVKTWFILIQTIFIVKIDNQKSLYLHLSIKLRAQWRCTLLLMTSRRSMEGNESLNCFYSSHWLIKWLIEQFILDHFFLLTARCLCKQRYKTISIRIRFLHPKLLITVDKILFIRTQIIYLSVK